jgi:hypothetical protein
VGTGTGAVAKVPGASVRGRASFTIPVFVEVLRHVPQVGPRQIYSPTRVLEMVACAAAVCRGPVTPTLGGLLSLFPHHFFRAAVYCRCWHEQSVPLHCLLPRPRSPQRAWLGLSPCRPQWAPWRWTLVLW